MNPNEVSRADRSVTDFQRRTGIARNILADRLRRVYALTAAGKDLFP